MQHQLNFKIEENTYDGRYIIILDRSEYVDVLPIDGAIMKAFVPGRREPLFLPFFKNSKTSYSSVSFKMSKKVTDLPDGIYDFTYSVCPNDYVYYKVTYLRTFQLESKIKNCMAFNLESCYTSSINQDGDFLKDSAEAKLSNALFMLDCGKAAATKKNPDSAIRFYNKAKVLFESIKYQ